MLRVRVGSFPAVELGNAASFGIQAVSLLRSEHSATGTLGLPGGKHDFHLSARIFDNIVHIYVYFGDPKGIFIGLGYAFDPVSFARVSETCLGANCKIKRRRKMIETYNVKLTKAVRGTAHQSISEAIAKGNIPQNSAKVCLWCILQQVSYFERRDTRVVTYKWATGIGTSRMTSMLPYAETNVFKLESIEAEAALWIHFLKKTH